MMRDIKLERDREWLVIITTRLRRDKPPLIKRTYWSMDEAALIVALLSKELPPVTSVPHSG